MKVNFVEEPETMFDDINKEDGDWYEVLKAKDDDEKGSSKKPRNPDKEGDISEDQSRDNQEDIQKLTDKFIAEIERHLAEKEEDILKV